LKATGQWTVIVLDNASVHRSFLVQNNWHQWQEQGLLLFFLPPYSPQMNRIEERWLHLKREELAGRIFEDEVDLAYGIIEGMKSQSLKGGWEVERFIFN
jgi:putative transposase